MRMPFESSKNSKSNGGFRRNNGSGGDNPFDGATELDIRTLTERVLKDDNDIGVITADGKIMTRNSAFQNGYRDGIQLVKDRVWGGEFTADAEDVCVEFSDEAKHSIVRESLRSPDTETGGALIGSWERTTGGRLSVRVERATGPGPDAVMEPALFSPNTDYYRFRVGYYREHKKWDYLGEWHKHPGSFDALSGTDIATAQELIRDEGWPLLLLPIVNMIDGRLVLENNIILSRQLGGGSVTRFMRMDLGEPLEETPFITYIDKRSVDDFRSGGESCAVLDGVMNPGESGVFISVPGTSNAALKLVRAGGEASVSGLRNVVTAVVSDDDVCCFRAEEGDIVPAESVLIDPSNSIYERNAGLTETDVLRDKTVTLVGCGSLGSTIAMSLARAGVGTFRLFDLDRLSPVNIARHQAGLRDLGRRKTDVLRDLIHGTNPTINVDANNADIVNSADGYEAFCDAAVRSDLLICTTDTDDSRMLVNDIAVRHGIKSVQAGLHDRAASGIIHVYDPGSDEACFACHRSRVLVESSKRAEGVSYSDADDIRDMTVQPGLAAQINFVAEAAALRCIDALMDRQSLPSLTIIGVDSPDDIGGERGLCLVTRHLALERVPSCRCCGDHAPAADYDDMSADDAEITDHQDELCP